MKEEVIVRLRASFEGLTQTTERWGDCGLARDLQELLGCAEWENLAKVIKWARVAFPGARNEPHALVGGLVPQLRARDG